MTQENTNAIEPGSEAFNAVGSDNNAAPTRRSKKHIFFLCLTVLLWVGVPIARSALFDTDHQYANMAGIALGFFGSVFGLLALMTIPGATWKWRGFCLAIPIIAWYAIFSFYEFAGFSGEMWPMFRAKNRLAKNQGKHPEAELTIDANSAEMKGIESSQFLGSNRDGVIDASQFSMDWQSKMPEIVWKQPIGAGWSSFAVRGSLAVTLEQIDDQESLTALEVKTGIVVWRLKLPGRHSNPLGGTGPRSTPTIVSMPGGDRVIAQTACGIVVCTDLKNGQVIWKKDLLELAGIDQTTSEASIMWGRSGSPLVHKGKVIVPFGGNSKDAKTLHSLIAFDLTTGDQVWIGGDRQIAYASPVVATIAGTEQILTINEGSASGHDPETGKELWMSDWPSKSNGDACASQPIKLTENRILLSKGYALGSKVIEVKCDKSNEANTWSSADVWNNTRILKTKFTSAILYNGLLYGLSDGVLECVKPEDGTRVWRGGRFGQGQLLIVNGHCLVLSEDGRVVTIPTMGDKAGKSSAELQVLEGITWNVPTVAGPYLLVRNGEEAACLRSPAAESAVKGNEETLGSKTN